MEFLEHPPSMLTRARRAAVVLLLVLVCAATGRLLWGRREVGQMPTDVARSVALHSAPNSTEAANAVVQLLRDSEKNVEAIQSLARIGDKQAINALDLIERAATRR